MTPDQQRCPFCEIVAERAPATVVATTPHSVLIVPLTPVVDGHVLVIPRRHVIHAAVDPRVTAQTFADAAVWAQRQSQPFNLIANAGTEATQTVWHLHAHYVPRRANDGLALPWTGQHRRASTDPR